MRANVTHPQMTVRSLRRALVWLCSTVLFLNLSAAQASADTFTEIQQQMLAEIQRLGQQVAGLQQELLQLKQAQASDNRKMEGMEQSLVDIQSNATPAIAIVPTEALDDPKALASTVDLTDQQVGHTAQYSPHVLSNPWWENIELWGFAAAGYYDTGSGGTRDNGSFEVKEASLFFEAEVWSDISFFLELQTNRIGKDDDKFARTGEVYIHLTDIWDTHNSTAGLKIGRFDIPFGEEYLWQDAIDNPLITNSASYVYGWDEGLLAYGNWKSLGWVAALTDGTDTRSSDNNSDKAFNLKLFGDPLESLYLSASYMHNGDGEKSAIEFGGSRFQPVVNSAAGSSTSTDVSSDLAELNAKYKMGQSYLAITAGWGRQDDELSLHDRDFRWFTVEPYLQLDNNIYVVLRYSEIGTYDGTEGYQFDGKTFAGGSSAFGYDIERFRRFGLGLGWQPNPRTRAKLEIGRDWFDLIDASALEKDDNRNFIGIEMAVGF